MKMNYVAPEMEVLEVMVESGFAGSGSLDENSGGGSGSGMGNAPF